MIIICRPYLLTPPVSFGRQLVMMDITQNTIDMTLVLHHQLSKMRHWALFLHYVGYNTYLARIVE